MIMIYMSTISSHDAHTPLYTVFTFFADEEGIKALPTDDEQCGESSDLNLSTWEANRAWTGAEVSKRQAASVGGSAAPHSTRAAAAPMGRHRTTSPLPWPPPSPSLSQPLHHASGAQERPLAKMARPQHGPRQGVWLRLRVAQAQSIAVGVLHHHQHEILLRGNHHLVLLRANAQESEVVLRVQITYS